MSIKNLTIIFAVILVGLVFWQTVSFQNKNSMNNQIAQEFIKAINEQDIEKMASMMTDDHLFIDALNNQVRGKAEMKKAWIEYFRLFPDYQIKTTMIYEGANSVAMFGFVGESPKTGQSWQIPASFETVIEDNKIKIWSVVADTKTQSDIISQKQVDLGKTTRKVTSIGGVFFKSKDPNKLKDWYKKHLGLDTDQYGTNFEWRQSLESSKKGFTQWSPFSEKTKYFEPSSKDFMINYRVENLESLVEQLKKEGVTITDKIETFDYGKFVHILDLEGNKIELWEPNDVEYDKLVIGRTR